MRIEPEKGLKGRNRPMQAYKTRKSRNMTGRR
jgi:hypothetical protein